MTVEDILANLVGFQSVVGTPNGEIVEWIHTYCKAHGAETSVHIGPEGDRANLFVTIGPRDGHGYILSGHMDVVPANEPEWNSDPFTMRREGERLYGRGTSDMKGFIACALAALPRLSSMGLKHPIHLALSYDEEAGARGVPHLIAELPKLCEQPRGAIIGEPSGMQAVRAHKGKAAARIEVIGCPGHSSRPDLGRNAIHAMAEIVTGAVAYDLALAETPGDADFEPSYSTLQIGTIAGGQAVNIIPDRCHAEIELRAVPGLSPTELLEPVKACALALRERGFDVDWQEMSTYPGLSLAKESDLAALLADLTGKEVRAAVSYGTEAGLFQAAGIDAVICGPGEIDRAHRPNEYVEIAELADCQRMIEELARRLAA
ncbi:acetylornithine deacetylase [Hwanghaeella grinnelliae]|uniref:Acetylornithine deacetylase n=1 Tax=Hwanghaeella grinnelliae TaxID=2500179 RepID=A0A437QL54_9PROT|nr:acetylornithine deacetylase [Hwanghaeella grinnelliae]RVU35244.1 acetylornithine deacetylase [Hwanghaeella grinnelliae]